jgi:ribosomal protein L13E
VRDAKGLSVILATKRSREKTTTLERPLAMLKPPMKTISDEAGRSAQGWAEVEEVRLSFHCQMPNP